MNNNKALCPGGDPVVLLKHAADTVLEYLAQILKKYYKGEPLSENRKCAYIKSLHMKGTNLIR